LAGWRPPKTWVITMGAKECPTTIIEDHHLSRQGG
jgi:hypothetical protein